MQKLRNILWPAAWLAWLVLLLVVLLRVFAAPGSLQPGDEVRSVYYLFLRGGHHWLQGLDTYTGACDNFQYWPGFAAFMSLFALLPVKFGALLWTALNVALLLFAGVRFARAFLPPQWIWVGGFLLLLLPMSAEGVLNQQSNPMLVALVLLGAVQLTRGGWWSGSVLLLLPGLTKIAPFCYALLLLAIFPRQLWWRLPLVLLALVALPFVLQNPEYVWREYHSWGLTLGHENGQRWAYRDAWTLWEFFSGSAITSHNVALGMEYYRLVQLGAAGVAFLACLRLRYCSGGVDRLAAAYAVCAGMAWMLVFGPSTEIATCVSAAPALAWGMLRCRLTGAGFVLMLSAFALTALGASGDAEYHLRQFVRWLHSPDWHLTLLPLGGLLFWGWLLFYGSRMTLEERQMRSRQ